MSAIIKSFAIVAFAVAAVGCTVEGGRFKTGTGDDGIEGGNRPLPPGTVLPDGGIVGAEDAAIPVYDSSSPVNNLRPEYQMKSATQIANAITECFGAGRLSVSNPMRLGQTCTLPTTENGRCGFLPLRFAIGENIVSVQGIEFDGDESALKTGTRPDQLTLPAMSAMQHVANVVAANCIANGQTGLCKCDTQDTAAQMVARCLPNVPSSPELTAAINSFASTCAATDPNQGQGHAIASLVASFAFMKGN